MTTEAEIRAIVSCYDIWERDNQKHWKAPLFACGEVRELLRLLDEARAARCDCDEYATVHAPDCVVMVRETCRTLQAALDEARAELEEIDAALDSVTKCIAPTRARRIRDSFEHERLVTGAAVFDAEKAEQSVRQQCTYWMGEAKIAADALAEARAERDGARDLAEQYQRQIRALEEAVRQASTGCRERNHAGLDRLIGGPIENHAIVGPDKLSDGPQPWMGQDVAFLAMAVQEEIAALRAEAEANRRDAERWRYLKEVCSVTTRGRFAGMQDAEMQDAIDAAMQKEPLHD